MLNFIGGSDKMQLTTINKIISYLLVGSLAAALITLGFKEAIPDKLPEGGKIIAPLIFLASAAFLGCVIEGTRDLLAEFILAPLKRLSASEEIQTPWIMTALGLSKDLKRYRLSRRLFSQALEDKKEKYPEVVETNRREPLNFFAVSLFFEKVKPESLNWAASHYATYVLASGFLTLAALAGPFWCIYNHTIPCQYVVLWFAALYSLARLSISMYLYTWEVTFRHGYIILKDAAQSADQESASNT
ncbi:MAG: hypothetical protein D3916_17170 [Candidatus Electrothrix sp. MAN1_4]|nr:hypothetical protein [Candidatus Electrothrix sp. MAN1_4]